MSEEVKETNVLINGCLECPFRSRAFEYKHTICLLQNKSIFEGELPHTEKYLCKVDANCPIHYKNIMENKCLFELPNKNRVFFEAHSYTNRVDLNLT